jgi:hypothetical protein
MHACCTCLGGCGQVIKPPASTSGSVQSQGCRSNEHDPRDKSAREKVPKEEPQAEQPPPSRPFCPPYALQHKTLDIASFRVRKGPHHRADKEVRTKPGPQDLYSSAPRLASASATLAFHARQPYAEQETRHPKKRQGKEKNRPRLLFSPQTPPVTESSKPPN